MVRASQRLNRQRLRTVGEGDTNVFVPERVNASRVAAGKYGVTSVLTPFRETLAEPPRHGCLDRIGWENEDNTIPALSLQKLSSARNNVSLTTRSGHGQSEKARDGTQCHGRHQHRENCETWSEGQDMQGFGHGNCDRLEMKKSSSRMMLRFDDVQLADNMERERVLSMGQSETTCTVGATMWASC